MLLDVAMAAALLLLGNVVFRRFETRMSGARRLLKAVILVGITALISHYFGHTGVFIAFGLALLPVLFVHAYWLPRRGVNGWTGEPLKRSPQYRH